MLSQIEGVVSSPDGRQISYLLRGAEDAPTVVYLHGMPSCRREQLIFPDEVVERQTLRLLSVDRPGWGNTDALAGDRVTRVADVLTVCDALGVTTFPLMAMSAGGSYALTLAALAPDRVDRVVLLSAQMPYDDDDAIQGLLPDQLALVPLLRRGRSAALIEGVEGWRQAVKEDPLTALASAFGSLSARERALFESPSFRELIVDGMREGVHNRVDGALDDLLSWPTPFEVDLATIKCPVVAFHGTADNWEPLANLRRILDRLPNGQLIAADGLSHFAAELHPELVLALAR